MISYYIIPALCLTLLVLFLRIPIPSLIPTPVPGLILMYLFFFNSTGMHVYIRMNYCDWCN